MYLCIYIATHLHTVYVDWLQAVLESNSRSTWNWALSKLRDTLWGCDWACLEMQLETKIEWTQRWSWRPWSREPRDALRECDRASLETHLEAMIMQTWRPWSSKTVVCNHLRLEIHLVAVIERVWRCNWMPWSSEYGQLLRGGRWTVCQVLRLYSSVS